MEQPENYKLVSAGRWLQREAEQIAEAAEMINLAELGGPSTKAMMRVESQNMREVGDWLVDEGGDKS